ncbi:hypothetical protein N0V84_012749 [Fusarium piperis]|uniref:Myb-like domain-containing protein n=1 Tax=Fusarium piperis TaxID=1435070 RepID=A0A9W8W228_9HYPO|nr:hypothetical protein N0V84_012749 [Fusarium piperis]
MEARMYAARAGRYSLAPAPSLLQPRAVNSFNSSPTKSQGTQGSRGKLLGDPIPRRNAPVDTTSIASIPTVPTRVDDYTESSEDERFVEDPVQPTEGDEDVEPTIYSNEEDSLSEDDGEEVRAGLETNYASQKILELSIPELSRAADDLMEFLEKGDPDPDVFQGRLRIKRRSFQSIRAEYTDDNVAHFIDWTDFPSGSTTLARVNVVTAFDKLHDLSPDNERELSPFLAFLDVLIPSWFVPDQAMFQEPETMLALRTWLFIQSFSRQTSEADYRKSIASIFCRYLGDRKLTFAKLFAGGHFRSLGGDRDNDDELCSARISEIINIVHKKKAEEATSLLKEKFGLHQLIPELRRTFKAMYRILKSEENEPVQLDSGTSPFDEHQQEGMLGSQAGDSDAESQTIVGAGTDDEAEPSLFVGEESIRALHGIEETIQVLYGNQRGSMSPPWRQPLTVSGWPVPVDYPDHQNTDLLLMDSLPAPQPERKRHDPFVEDSDDDDDGSDSGEEWFEADTRSVEPQGLLGPPPPKKSRVQPPGPDSQISLSQTQDPSSATAPSQSSVPELGAVDESRAEVALQNRLSPSQGQQQRVKWNSHDTSLLLELIKEYHTGWSTIEAQGKDRFQTPRNQQACRDKARNIKVKLLQTDKLLPPNFDEVWLGPKEISKVLSMGKNPFRKVADVDDEDRPIGTEFSVASM